MGAGMMQWLRRRFVTGFFVLVPLVISFVALVWLFDAVDGFTDPLYQRFFRTGDREVPRGLGIVTTAVVVLVVGVGPPTCWASVCCSGPKGISCVFRYFGPYGPVKQLVLAFSPDNEYGFKRVVMIRTESRGYILGFLTKEFSIQSAGQTESLIAVYVPTNHLYLGDVVICRREHAFFPDLSVEEGIRVFLTGGMTLPPRLADKRVDNVTGRS
jgi:uncharacterized membrane protein